MDGSFEYDFDVRLTVGENSQDIYIIPFAMEIKCVTPAFMGSFNPITGVGSPPEGPEFDFISLYFKDQEGRNVAWSWKEGVMFLGQENMERTFFEACDFAEEVGGF